MGVSIYYELSVDNEAHMIEVRRLCGIHAYQCTPVIDKKNLLERDGPRGPSPNRSMKKVSDIGKGFQTDGNQRTTTIFSGEKEAEGYG